MAKKAAPRKSATAKKNVGVRKHSQTTTVARRSPSPRAQTLDFAEPLLTGTCIVCQSPLRDHFANDGRWVGCVGQRRSGEGVLFVPPLMLMLSPALTSVIQTTPGVGRAVVENIGAHAAMPRPREERAAAADRPRAAQSPGGSKVTSLRGRTAGAYFPAVKALKDDVAENVSLVFSFIKKHEKTGTSQKAIQDELGMPHSTVWYALVKLRDMGAIKYQSPSVKPQETKAA